MMRTLWAGVTGLQNHQTRMDVIGNNIANVNTVGYKKSEVVFEDLLSQTLEVAHGPSDGKGGTNAQQIGLGVKIGSITQVHTQGQLQLTGKNTDLAIQGNGFFVLNSGSVGDNHFTRNGSFNLDGDGYMVASNGYKVQGWMSSADPVTGQIRVDSSTNPITDVRINVGDTIPAHETTTVTFSGNLNSNNNLAINPVVVEFTQDNVSRQVEMRFEHAHPTLNYYFYKAYWYDNPPTGTRVGDAAIDFNTGQQVQGIMRLDDNGQVIGNFRNTDLATSVNATIKTSMASLDPASTISLTSVDAVDNSGPSAGMYRLRFQNALDLTEYTLTYSANFDASNPASATWSAVTNDDLVSGSVGNTTQNERFGDVNIKLSSADWRGMAAINDTLYFEVAAGNANGILDLPSEIPQAIDDHPLFRTSAVEGWTDNGALSFANVDSTLQQSAVSAPAGGNTFRNWRVLFTSANAYDVQYADYGSAFDPHDTTLNAAYDADGGGPLVAPLNPNPGNGGTLAGVGVEGHAVADNWTILFTAANTYTITGAVTGLVINGSTATALDVAGLSIPAANWGGAPVAGDTYQFQTTSANTWTTIGAGDYNPANADADFNSAVHGIIIPEENFSGTFVAGETAFFRVNTAKSNAYNRDFFTLKDSVTQFNNDLAAGGANAGTAALSAVDVEATAPADTWTITFTAPGVYDIAGANTGTIGTGVSTAATFSALGLEIQASYWTGVAVAGDTFTFSTVENAVLSDIVLPSGNTQAESITFLPNTTDTTMNTVDAGNPVTATVNNRDTYQYATSVDTYDSLGAAHTLTYFFERKDTNKWMWSVMDPTPKDPNNIKMAGYGILAFEEDGTYDSANSVTFNSEVGLDSPTRPSNLQKVIYDPSDWGGAPPPAEGAGLVEITLNFADLVQYAATNDGEIFSQDGYGKGTLNSFTVNKLGFITGLYDNGRTMDIGRVAIASFNNPAGLITEGDSLYRLSGNSGTPHIGVPGLAGRGSIAAGALEMSNVDLSEEFTNMIVTQRGFQANSRSITTADQMLQELLTLKR